MSYGLQYQIYPYSYAPPRGVGVVGTDPQVEPGGNISSGEKLLVGGVVAAVLVGVGWLVYKRVQLYHKIAEKEGSTGVMKLTAVDTGAYLATKAFD